MLRGLDSNKDQSYFLHALKSEQIRDALFPLGEIDKSKVRETAKLLQLKVHDKKDSTGICFIGERKFRDFLQRFIPAQPGKIITLEGQEIGEHQGLMYYTIGQRQGLGIGGMKGAAEIPWFVADKDISNNNLIVVQGHDHPALFKGRCTIQDLHWINPVDMTLPFHCSAKIRYRQSDQACRIQTINGRQATVHFEQPQRAVTPGQSLVFYQNDVCLGGGIIQ